MRALILSDIHGNLEALHAVLDAAGAYDELWNLGDMVGYGASPNQVLDLLRPIATLNVRGNHDRVCCGLTPSTGFNPVARAAAQWTQTELTPDHLEWLRNVPQGPLYPLQQDVTCVHGSPLNEDQYILNMRDAWAPLQQMTTAITFFGHTHVQGGFAQKEHDWREFHPRFHTRNEPNTWTLPLLPGLRHLINPGSVGQPRDCDWRAAFAIYDTDTPEGPAIIFHRVPYDLTTAQGRILMAGLPERLAARLREGR
ncbi:metallophosphoesterase family protein [Granulicella arctica]|uniref:Putative phosphodiesterase n=1 Tax=Granulicella arctica TaxID=940613 RepID=A0A7Y9PEG0_9BACT|nr:metallophosphoesterase family protein [Granulicella arctica]NYF78302.1 putative phosphodiesterase [Granulicella arctica]